MKAFALLVVLVLVQYSFGNDSALASAKTPKSNEANINQKLQKRDSQQASSLRNELTSSNPVITLRPQRSHISLQHPKPASNSNNAIGTAAKDTSMNQKDIDLIHQSTAQETHSTSQSNQMNTGNNAQVSQSTSKSTERGTMVTKSTITTSSDLNEQVNKFVANQFKSTQANVVHSLKEEIQRIISMTKTFAQSNLPQNVKTSLEEVSLALNQEILQRMITSVQTAISSLKVCLASENSLCQSINHRNNDENNANTSTKLISTESLMKEYTDLLNRMIKESTIIQANNIAEKILKKQLYEVISIVLWAKHSSLPSHIKKAFARVNISINVSNSLEDTATLEEAIAIFTKYVNGNKINSDSHDNAQSFQERLDNCQKLLITWKKQHQQQVSAKNYHWIGRPIPTNQTLPLCTIKKCTRQAYTTIIGYLGRQGRRVISQLKGKQARHAMRNLHNINVALRGVTTYNQETHIYYNVAKFIQFIRMRGLVDGNLKLIGMIEQMTVNRLNDLIHYVIAHERTLILEEIDNKINQLSTSKLTELVDSQSARQRNKLRQQHTMIMSLKCAVQNPSGASAFAVDFNPYMKRSIAISGDKFIGNINKRKRKVHRLTQLENCLSSTVNKLEQVTYNLQEFKEMKDLIKLITTFHSIADHLHLQLTNLKTAIKQKPKPLQKSILGPKKLA